MAENKYSEDLKVNRSLNVRTKTTNVTSPKVIEIGFSFYAVPKEGKPEDEYAEDINQVIKKCNRSFKRYAYNNGGIYKNKVITDFSFSTANLKKGYNKYVTMSMFLRVDKDYKYDKIQRETKKTIKDCAFEVSKAVQESGFSCYKTKH